MSRQDCDRLRIASLAAAAECKHRSKVGRCNRLYSTVYGLYTCARFDAGLHLSHGLGMKIGLHCLAFFGLACASLPARMASITYGEGSTKMHAAIVSRQVCTECHNLHQLHEIAFQGLDILQRRRCPNVESISNQGS